MAFRSKRSHAFPPGTDVEALLHVAASVSSRVHKRLRVSSRRAEDFAELPDWAHSIVGGSKTDSSNDEKDFDEASDVQAESSTSIDVPDELLQRRRLTDRILALQRRVGRLVRRAGRSPARRHLFIDDLSIAYSELNETEELVGTLPGSSLVLRDTLTYVRRSIEGLVGKLGITMDDLRGERLVVCVPLEEEIATGEQQNTSADDPNAVQYQNDAQDGNSALRDEQNAELELRSPERSSTVEGSPSVHRPSFVCRRMKRHVRFDLTPVPMERRDYHSLGSPEASGRSILKAAHDDTLLSIPLELALRRVRSDHRSVRKNLRALLENAASAQSETGAESQRVTRSSALPRAPPVVEPVGRSSVRARRLLRAAKREAQHDSVAAH